MNANAAQLSDRYGESSLNRTSLRYPAAIFVILQAVMMLWLGVGSPWLITIMLTLLLVGVVFGPRFELSTLTHGLLLTMMAIVLLVLRLGAIWRQANIGLVFSMFAEYLLLVQCLEFCRPLRDPTNNYLPGLGCLGIASMVMSFNSTLRESTLHWIYLSTMAMLILALRPDFLRLLFSKRRLQFNKAFTLGIFFLSTIASGGLFQQELRRDLPELQKRLSMFRVSAAQSLLANNDARFVETVTLHSVTDAQRKAPAAIVFTVETNRPPGYMRTLSFQSFVDGRWRKWNNQVRSPRVKRLDPLQDVPAGVSAEDADVIESGRLFQLKADAQNVVQRMVVRVPSARGKVVPLPQHVGYLYGRVRRMILDQYDLIGLGTVDSSGYVVYTQSNQRTQLRPEVRDALLEPLTEDRAFLNALSSEICSGSTTTRQKIRAVESHFQDNFAYSLVANLRDDLNGRSVLRAFLEDQRAAHCEFFATASVFLLRSQGIPCRMSTGYLAYELNDEEDYFVAANRNAHAWAEAWDEESEQWRIVESTPGISDYVRQYEGLTNDEAESIDETSVDSSQTNHWLRFQLWISSWFAWISTGRWTWLVPVVMTFASIAWISRGKASANQTYGVHRFSAHLKRADQYAAKCGFHRRANETCHQFAKRLTCGDKFERDGEPRKDQAAEDSPLATDASLRPLAQWYVEFANQRYLAQPGAISSPPKPRDRARA